MMEAGTEEFLFVDAQPQTEANIQVNTKGNQGFMSLNARWPLLPEPMIKQTYQRS